MVKSRNSDWPFIQIRFVWLHKWHWKFGNFGVILCASQRNSLAKKTTPNFWLPVRSLKPRCVIMFLWFFSNKIPFGTIGTFPSIIIKIHAQNFWGHWQNFLMIFESVNCYHPVWCTLRFPKRVSPEETPDVCSHIPWYEVMQERDLITHWLSPQVDLKSKEMDFDHKGCKLLLIILYPSIFWTNSSLSYYQHIWTLNWFSLNGNLWLVSTWKFKANNFYFVKLGFLWGKI